jgi:hypothetical protein
VDVLARIKHAVLGGHIGFTRKARGEMEADGITEGDVVESIACAGAIHKRLRSTSSSRSQSREYLYVILNTNLRGTLIYTKGKLVPEAGVETFYLLVSSKLAL